MSRGCMSHSMRNFLAAVQIVVYAGAILVLYLFVVMLLNVKTEERYHDQCRWLVYWG